MGLINLKVGDAGCDEACANIYKALQSGGRDVLYDDRDERAGVKFADVELIGLPWQLVVGPKGIEKGLIELKRRDTGAREELSVEAAIAKLTASSS